MKFLEIEHKFIVEESFDWNALREQVKDQIVREVDAQVTDTYFVTALAPDYIYRHRIDDKLQQLTVKSRDSNEIRLEVNLDLCLAKGNQIENVVAFLTPAKIIWQGSLKKDLKVIYLRDCEIAFYIASTPENRVACLEFEAINASSEQEALETLRKYEALLQISQTLRSDKSLFELLLLP